MIQYYNVILANINEDFLGDNLLKATEYFQEWEKEKKERIH
jgi:hypothetical protein